MAKTKDQKKQILAALTEAFQKSKLIVLSEIKGLNVADTTQLRRVLRAEQVGHRVVKLSLLKLALRKLGIKADELDFKTQVAVSFGSDETAPARILKEFSNKHEHLKFLGAFLEKQYVDARLVSKLADVPPRPVLLAQLLSVLSGPARGLVSVLSGNHRGLVSLLSQIKKQ